jgi:hypothetical protein
VTVAADATGFKCDEAKLVISCNRTLGSDAANQDGFEGFGESGVS